MSWVSKAFHKAADTFKPALNPLKYGDALGLTSGPLSGRIPGKLTDRGIDIQAKLNPGISRSTLKTANDVAPFVAASIATFGGSAVAEGAGGMDAWEGLYSAPTEMDTVYGVSGIESAPADLAASAQASTLMPPAIPELDPTFGGTLVESSPGVYTPAQPSNALSSLASAADKAAKAAGLYRTVRGLLSSPKHADVSPTASAPWKNPLGGANNDTRDTNDMLKSNAIGAGFIFVIVAAILFALFFRR